MFAAATGLREVQAQEAALEALCGRLDPDAVPGPQVEPMHASLARMERLVAGARLRLGRRVEESGAWRRAGDRSAAKYLARTTGTSTGTATEALATSKRLATLPETEAAVTRGELSSAQAGAVSDAAASAPAAERTLLEAARTESLPELRERCRRTKAAADPDPDATYRRIHAGRYLRRHTDAEGAYNLNLRTTADAGGEIDAALAPFIDAVFARARQAGQRDSAEAYLADALVDLARSAVAGEEPVDDEPSDEPAGAGTTGGIECSGEDECRGPARPDEQPGTDAPRRPSRVVRRATRRASRRREAKVIALVDYEALVRGRAVAGETAEIAGVGAVPVSTIRSMLTDAFLALVVTDGVDVFTVAHAGRQVTAHQRSALEARGYRCEVPGCGARHNLEIDHISGWALTRRTALDELAWLCRHHHGLKTHGGYRLTGSPGQRSWTGPECTTDLVGGAEGSRPAPTGPDPPPSSGTRAGSLFDEAGAA